MGSRWERHDQVADLVFDVEGLALALRTHSVDLAGVDLVDVLCAASRLAGAAAERIESDR